VNIVKGGISIAIYLAIVSDCQFDGVG